jgi:hypothetical protein
MMPGLDPPADAAGLHLGIMRRFVFGDVGHLAADKRIAVAGEAVENDRGWLRSFTPSAESSSPVPWVRGQEQR